MNDELKDKIKFQSKQKVSSFKIYIELGFRTDLDLEWIFLSLSEQRLWLFFFFVVILALFFPLVSLWIPAYVHLDSGPAVY